jgi:hypothetical protein
MHYGTHMREAFSTWVERGMQPLAEVEVRYEAEWWPSERLLGAMVHCTDIMPSELCAEVELERGSSYARAAQHLLAEQRARARSLA